MVLVSHPGELFEAHPFVLVGVLHAGLGEHARHGLSSQDPVDAGHRPISARRLVDVGVVLGAATQKAHFAHLFDAESQAHLGLPGPNREIDGT